MAVGFPSLSISTLGVRGSAAALRHCCPHLGCVSQRVQEEQGKAGGCGRQVPTQPSEVHERSGMAP